MEKSIGKRYTFMDLYNFANTDTPPVLSELDECIKQSLFFIVNGGQSLYITLSYMIEHTKSLEEFYYRLYIKPIKSTELQSSLSGLYLQLPESAEKKEKDKKNTISLYDYINNRKKKIMYAHYTFRPVLANIPTMYNIFKGFVHQKYDGREKQDDFQVDKDKIRPILTHLLVIWCSSKSDVCAYILNWFSWILQKPWIKTSTMLILLGKQGVGKTVILECFIKYVFGKEYGVITSDLDKLTSRFNSLNVAKVMIGLDDLKITTKSQSKKLKTLITEEDNVIEKKGDEPGIMPSYANYIQLADKIEDLIDSKEMARRSLLLECDYSYAHDTEKGKQYFTEWYDTISDPINWQHFAHWLMQRDISSFSPRDKPETDLQVKLKTRTMDPILLFLKALVDGDIDKYSNNEDYQEYTEITEDRKIPISELLAKFKLWGKENDYSTKEYTAPLFSAELSNLNIGEIKRSRFRKEIKQPGILISGIEISKKLVIAKYNKLMGIDTEEEQIPSSTLELTDSAKKPWEWSILNPKKLSDFENKVDLSFFEKRQGNH